MEKVTCISCLGTGWITDRGAWNMDTSHTCYICDGSGYISINNLKISIEEYEKQYNNNYNSIGSKRFKNFKILKE